MNTTFEAAHKPLVHHGTGCNVLTRCAAETVDWLNAGENLRKLPVAALAGIPMRPPA